MTKKERIEMERLAVLAALRWTSDGDIKPDVPPPEGSEPDTVGWRYSTYSRRAYQAWSSSIYHGEGPARLGTASQRPISLFSSKSLALRAMRYEVELEAARNLRIIDQLIADEEGNQ